jgi:hypothetical protein
MAALLPVVVMSSAGCGTGGLVRQYEYEEEIRLNLDGSATVMVNASIPALVALRGFDLDVHPRARLDRAAIRQAFESPTTRVTRVSRPWRRHGRRFVHVRLQVEDIRQLPLARPFSWSEYSLEPDGDQYVYRQMMGEPAGRPVGEVGWNGRELVAFRMHLPSKIYYHNAPSRRVERGNILVWEQPLQARLTGVPLAMEARLDGQSILYRALWLFGLAFAAAVTMLGSIVFWVARKG